MIIFNAGSSVKPVKMTDRYHRLLSYYYLKDSKNERRELRRHIKRNCNGEKK